MGKERKLVSVIIVTRKRRKELTKCLLSLQASNYKYIEIIVIDNGDHPPIHLWLKKIFKKVKIIRSHKNIGAAGGRNLGSKYAKGEYLLFIDDDAEVDKEMVSELVKLLDYGKRIGIVQPKIYDMEKRNILQGLGCDVNLFTGRVSAVGIREEDKGLYDNIRELQSVGCIWMVKREVIDKIGGYDEEYFIPWEDTDFSYRARKAGFNILFAPKALAWHKGIKSTFINPLLDYIGIRNSDRAYRIARNKIIFMVKHAPFFNLFIFFLIFLPIITFVHSIIILLSLRFDLLLIYWKGVASGLFYALRKLYFDFDNYINPFKVFILSLEDPVCWIIDKSAQSILDIGCGQGFPMKMIKNRMQVRKSVGVDLFKPYIEIGEKYNIHDQYIISDVRKLNFKDKSFDVVLALQILEHLKKNDAWKVVNKIERIAKKQVIIATPIGKMYHPIVDNNKLQLHKSAFYPEEFEKKGYKILKFGRKEILGEEGLVHRLNNDLFRKNVYTISYLMNICLYFFQPLANYYFVAHKKVNHP